jgi:hypothetical protein
MRRKGKNMNQQADTNNSSLSSDFISSKLESFESTVENLAKTVEDARHKIEHVTDLANKSKEEILHIRDSLQTAMAPIMPLVDKASDVSMQAVRKVRQNPRPYALVFAGIVGSLLLMTYIRGSSSSNENYLH